MPDLTGFPAIDVAIGLAFLFFLLSTVCAAINEGIASALAWRAKNLEDAIARLLGEVTVKEKKYLGGDRLTDQVMQHWRITALVKDPDAGTARKNRPSYIPARAFSRAISDVVAALPAAPAPGQPAPGQPAQGQPAQPVADKSAWQRADEALMAEVKQGLDRLPQGTLTGVLHKAAAIAGNDLERFRTEMENAFNDTMERASGWYKRRIQIALLVIAVGVTVALNVDTIRVGDSLWKNPALRSSVSAVAVQAANKAGEQPKTVGDTIAAVKELNVPIGWGGGNEPKHPHLFLNIVRRVPGWIFTVLALCLGAPFWFDVLSRFARLRGSGPPAEPHTQSDQPPSTAAGSQAGSGAAAAGAAAGAPAEGRVTSI